MKHLNPYAHLDALELARQPGFQRWVLDPDLPDTTSWTDWIDQSPDFAATVEEARLLVFGLEQTQSQPAPEAIHQSYARLRTRLPQLPERPFVTITRPWWSPVLRYAALITLLIGLGWIGMQYANRTPNYYQTAFGEVKEITLPDGSRVTLNANSALTMADWQPDGPRRVKLRGEAYFAVAKQTVASGARRPFVVQTNDAEVRVVGTRFNVVSRHQQTRIVLEEGRVDVVVPNRPLLVMKPGDLVEAGNGRLRQQRVNPKPHLAWQRQLLVFDDATLTQIARQLGDQYGWSVRVTQTTLWSERVTTTVPADKPDLLLQLLAETIGCRVSRQDTLVLFTPIESSTNP